MNQMNIRVPEELKRKAKSVLALQNKTIQEYIAEKLQELIAEPK